MKAAPEDRLESSSGSGGSPLRIILLLAAIAVVALLFWRSASDEPETVQAPPLLVEETAVAEAEPLPVAEDIPQRSEPVPAQPEEPVSPPLPELENSDSLMREEMLAAGLAQLQEQQNLVQMGTSLVDGFSRGLVLYKLLPVKPPEDPFVVAEVGDQMLMDPAGYQRYDEYADAIAALNTDVLAASFHRMRPLYEQAYAQLGLDPADFDNAIIRTLDRVLATPEIEAPIPLTRKSVMYQYADPELEQLSPMQKQLLRMGPDNIRRIKAQAQALRSGLLQAP